MKSALSASGSRNRPNPGSAELGPRLWCDFRLGGVASPNPPRAKYQSALPSSRTQEVPQDKAEHRQYDYHHGPQDLLARVGSALQYIDDGPDVCNQDDKAPNT